MIEFIRVAALAQESHATLTLTYERRQRSRQRVVLDDGTEAALLLAHGERPDNGAVVESEDGYRALVAAAFEEVSAVRTQDSRLLARAAYHLGNRHVAVQINGDSVYYVRDHVLDEMLRGLGLEVIHEVTPFEPEAGAYAQHAHAQDHGHADSADHAHGRTS